MTYQGNVTARELEVVRFQEPGHRREDEVSSLRRCKQAASQHPIPKPSNAVVAGGVLCRVLFERGLPSSFRFTQGHRQRVALLIRGLPPTFSPWRSRSNLIELLDDVLHRLLIERHVDTLTDIPLTDQVIPSPIGDGPLLPGSPFQFFFVHLRLL